MSLKLGKCLGDCLGLAAVQPEAKFSTGQFSTDSTAVLRMRRSLKKLQSLETCGGGITDAGAAHLANLPSLTSLSLAQNGRVGNAALPLLVAGLKGLTHLNLAHTRVSSSGMQHLAGLTVCDSLLPPLLQPWATLHQTMFWRWGRLGLPFWAPCLAEALLLPTLDRLRAECAGDIPELRIFTSGSNHSAGCQMLRGEDVCCF